MGQFRTKDSVGGTAEQIVGLTSEQIVGLTLARGLARGPTDAVGTTALPEKSLMIGVS